MAATSAHTKRSGSSSDAAQVRVMIVDDSLTARTVLKRVIEQDARLQLSASANSAEQAIAMLDTVQVDVILLDLEMPGMGGLEGLPKILAKACDAQVLVVSSLTTEGAEATLAALSMGAADTLLKPGSGRFDSEYRANLLQRILELGCATRDESDKGFTIPERPARPARREPTPRLVAIGASTGGIHALTRFLSHLPRDIDLPILVTQHLPASFFPVFARQLELASSRPASVVANGETRPGAIHIAPPDGHLTVTQSGSDLTAKIVRFTANSGCMPSVDPMLASIAETLGPTAVCVMLSGMGRDGLEGARLLAKQGGTILAQDPESSAVWGMPGAVARDGLAEAVLPPDRLAHRVASRLRAPAWS